MVGFFDSGVGGTCVLEAFRRLCPEEPTVYVADTENCPYGNKPPEEIVRLSKRIAADLIDRGCEVVVVACNTATAGAIDTLRATWPDVPFVGMEPAIKPAALGSKTGVVGVLATRGTFNGRLYRQTSSRVPGSVKIIEAVADEFVTLVERGENLREFGAEAADAVVGQHRVPGATGALRRGKRCGEGLEELVERPLLPARQKAQAPVVDAVGHRPVRTDSPVVEFDFEQVAGLAVEERERLVEGEVA